MLPAIFRPLLTAFLVLFLAACAVGPASLPSTRSPGLPSVSPPATSTPPPSVTPTHQPAPTRTLHSLPTPPPMAWQVPVLQFNFDWNSPYNLASAWWVDERTFSIQTFPGQKYQVRLDGRGGLALTAPADANQPRSYSPHRRFLAECSASELSLYRLPERQLVGRAALAVPDGIDFLTCNQFIQWATDDSALMFTLYPEPFNSKNHPRAFYLWKTAQPQPRRLATATFEDFGGYISPDFKHLMYIAGRAMQADKPGAVETLLVDILDVDSGEVTHLRLKEAGYEIYPQWLTDHVLEFRIGKSTYRYFNSQTGQYLFQFYDSMASGDFHQLPAVSPDRRWVTLDHTQPVRVPAKRYSLYDLQTESEILLSESPASRLSFCGWKPDSSRLYLVNSPNIAFTALDSPLPAGLLAYDPLARRATVLVPDAVRAFWSPDMQHAWVIRQPAAGQPLTASLYEAASSRLSGEYFVSGKPVAGDPAWDWLGLDFELRWSHDSTRTLLVNARGELFLLSGSEARLLAKGSYRPVSWSPDDRYALVYYARGAWVVELPR